VFFKREWKISGRRSVMCTTFPHQRASPRRQEVSDEERKVHAKENDEDTGAEDVEAHVRSGRHANDEGDDDGGDDVEAHVRSGR
jgi:hypothetical protein